MSLNMKRTNSWNEKNDAGSSGSVQPTQRRKSLAPDSLLPPIREGTQSSDSPSTAMASSQVTREVAPNSVVNDKETNARSNRGSVSSITSCDSETSNKGAVRKKSLTKNYSSASRESSKKETTKRRVSVSNLLQVGRKASFRTIGAKVSTLIKARNAFSRLKKSAKDEADQPDDESVFEIKDLPKSPRFASTLSVEAQYAMMKGYEDIVYNNLCSSYPEYRTVLRRNRTPISGVQVRENIGKDGGSGGKLNKSANKGRETVTSPCLRKSSNVAEQPKTSTPAPGSSRRGWPELHEERTDMSLTDPPVNVNVNHPPPSHHYPGNKATRLRVNSSLSRHRSLPHLVPKDKQLVMTYRYQSAMDILDTVRTRTGVHTLSPRVKHTPPKIEPVKEFNSWAFVWNKEFEVKSAVAKT